LSEVIVVFGAGEHVKIVLSTIEAEAKYEVVGLLDDDKSKYGNSVYKYRVLGGRGELARLKAQDISSAVVAIGNNRARDEVAGCLSRNGFHLVNAIHPSSTLLHGCTLGEGTVVLPYAYIGADTVVGPGVILSVGSVVGHDCEVGAWAHLCPGAKLAGNVRIGEATLIGMNASVLPGVMIGPNAVVGANAVVIDNLPGEVTAVGIPAKIIIV
jgi:sugar O-acyltransferase (sialic acid O-acetyltransferase NeuD family)